jgi:hypothetical protein
MQGKMGTRMIYLHAKRCFDKGFWLPLTVEIEKGIGNECKNIKRKGSYNKKRVSKKKMMIASLEKGVHFIFFEIS